MIKKCIGCGIELQNFYKDKAGYTPKNLFDAKYCERCFKIINYNTAKIVTLDKEENEIINIINEKAKFVVFLIDLLNINNETIDMFKRINTNKVLIVSKSDILPKSIKKSLVSDWIQNTYNIEEDIIFCSAIKKFNIQKIIDYLVENKIKTSYVLGYTNSGKSTLINEIFNKYQTNKSMITTSLIPNTTLDFIKLKVNKDITLIDSPGFVLSDAIYKIDELDFIKKINTKKVMKPTTFQTKESMVINISNKVIIKNMTDKNSMTFYVPNDVEINKTFKYKVINGYEKRIYDLDDNIDIVIKGLGFINVKKSCELEISMLNHDLIEIRNSFFKGDYYE